MASNPNSASQLKSLYISCLYKLVLLGFLLKKHVIDSSGRQRLGRLLVCEAANQPRLVEASPVGSPQPVV